MHIYNSEEVESQIRRVNCILFVAILCGFLLKLFLIFWHKIGWDEFHFLSMVHSYQNGNLTQTFQTFHVHLLGWVPWVSVNEVYQIIAARYFLFLLFVGSGILLYLIARHFFHKTGALFSVFCWVSFSNIIHHGSSLRYDSFCSFFFLLACFALLKDNKTRLWSAIAGIAMGLSLLISVKASIHVVSLFAMLSVLLVISAEKKLCFQKAVYFITLMALTYWIGLSIHQNTLPTVSVVTPQSFFKGASSKAITLDKFFSNIWFFSETVRYNLVIWWLLVVGVYYKIFEFKKNREKKWIIALTFLVPLFSILFYRNAFPYYYVFIMAPAILFCGILPQRILQEFKKTGSKAQLIKFTIIFLIIFCGAGVHFFNSFGKNNNSQAELFSVIHKMFPEPVPYIDGCSAVASFPKIGFFMSTWGFENYLTSGQPVFRRLLEEKQPQFMLANTPHLDFKVSRNNSFFEINYDFLEEDRKILEENFINFWGMLWLPGKTLNFEMSGEIQKFEILIPGPYIIESNEQVILNNQLKSPGAEIFLTTGSHTAQAVRNAQSIVLRWNNVDYIPQYNPPATSFFYGF
jgi:hypothetical protein